MSRTPKPPTLDDILEAVAGEIAAAQPDGQQGVTVRELRKRYGWGEYKAREKVRVLLEAGRWEAVQVMRTRMDGHPCLVTGYRPK